jgi:hypothetical protein
VLAVLAALGAVGSRPAWSQELPTAPVPVLAGPPTAPSLPPGAGSAAQVPAPAPVFLPGPPACAPYEDCNGPLLRGDPLLDRPQYPLPGCFAAFEVGILVPHVKNRLVAGNLSGTDPLSSLLPNQVHVPGADLDWTGSPRIELGYRLPEGFGEFLIAYRSLVSEGSDVIPSFDIDGSDGVVKSRINVNVLDLDYGSREYALGPHWDMKWKAGVRLASVFYDSLAVGPFLEQRVSNDFRGIGPHLGLDLWRYLEVPGLVFFGRLESAALIGRINQGFGQSLLFDDGTLVGSAATVRTTQAVPVVDFQLGLSWLPLARRNVRLAAGYRLEAWWYLGQTSESRAELIDQGVFLRAEVGF